MTKALLVLLFAATKAQKDLKIRTSHKVAATLEKRRKDDERCGPEGPLADKVGRGHDMAATVNLLHNRLCRDDGDAAAHDRLFAALLLTRNSSGALFHAQEAARLHPDVYAASLAEHLMQGGQYDYARALCEAFFERWCLAATPRG